jgi:hypothetical protein
VDDFFNYNLHHPEPSPMKGRPIFLKDGKLCLVVDWFDRVAGKSWTESPHPAAAVYREAHRGTIDEDVLLCIFNKQPLAVHTSEVQRVMPIGWLPPDRGPQPEEVKIDTKVEVNSEAVTEPKPIFVSPDPKILEELKAMKAHFDILYRLLGL